MIKETIIQLHNQLNLEEPKGKCRKVTFEIVKRLRNEYQVDEAYLVIDRQYRNLKHAPTGEHVVGVVRLADRWYAFDGTISQVVGFSDQIHVWESATLSSVIGLLSEDIGGSWTEQIIGPGSYAKLRIEP